MNRLGGIGRQVACKREATRSRYARGMPIDEVGSLHAAPAYAGTGQVVHNGSVYAALPAFAGNERHTCCSTSFLFFILNFDYLIIYFSGIWYQF